VNPVLHWQLLGEEQVPLPEQAEASVLEIPKQEN
jgi:hypothetical protein